MQSEEIDLDTGMLESLRDLLGDKFVELITTYNRDCAVRLDKIREALPARDYSVINHEAHGVKGSSRNLGANSLAQLCGELEAKAKTGDGSDMEQLFSAIEQQFAAIAARLESLI